MVNKTDLLAAIAGKNRGLLATDRDRQFILAIAAQLEERNPTPQPLETPEKLAGNWRLVYTSSKDLLGLDRLPLVKLGEVYQCIRPQQIYNIAELYGIPFLETVVSVVAKITPLSEKRIQVEFERSISGFKNLLGYQSPDQFISQIQTGQKFLGLDIPIKPSNRQAWLDITYLDNDLRIARGNKGSLFILTKP
jgi:PAP_fibrillin